MINYPIGESGQVMILSDNVLDQFKRHTQSSFWQPEAGGQLFARLTESEIAVEIATGPYREDKRGRSQFIPDPVIAQRDIDRLHADGLHFVGHWHTHPERRPKPSRTDLESIVDNFRRSTHHLNAFVLAIAGTAPFPTGLHVSLHDEHEAIELTSIQTAHSNNGPPERVVRLI